MRITLSIFILFLSSFAFAKPILLNESFVIKEATTISIEIGETVFLKNLVIQAEGLNRDSTVEVMVNGEVKGTIYAPGSDPSYIVTIAEETSSVEFRHRAGGAMQVLDVLVMAEPNSIQSPIEYNIHKAEGVLNLAKAVIEISNVLAPFTSQLEESLYLLPIKKKAGRVLVMSQAHGELSTKTITALKDMARSVDYAQPYLDRLLEKPALFDHAVEILMVREIIQELLD